MRGFPHVQSWLIGVFGLDFLNLKLSIVAFGVGSAPATFASVRGIAVQLLHRSSDCLGGRPLTAGQLLFDELL